MKKHLVSLLIMILIFASFISCGRGTDDAGGDTEDTSQGSVQVGVVLPNEDDMRWIQDETIFRTTFENAGVSSSIMFSEGSTATELFNVQELLEKGIKVLVICAQDTAAAGAAVQAARDEDVTVICYDRLVEDTDAIDYYVTYDFYAAGKAQGQSLIDKFTGKKNVPLYLYAGKANGSNSLMLFSGAWSVLNKAVKNGQFVVENCSAMADYAGKELDPKKDRETLKKILSEIDTDGEREKTGKNAKNDTKAAKSGKNAKKDTKAAKIKKKDAAVLALDDEAARAASDDLSSNKKIKSCVVTGQGAEPASLGYIQKGKQYMTVSMDTSELAAAACDMANTILAGEKPETNTAYDNGLKEVPAYSVAGRVIDAESLKQLISEGVYSQEDIDNAK